MNDNGKKVRLTEISTPLGNLSWEDSDRKERGSSIVGTLGFKIRAFISSKCGDNGKYDKIRKEIKNYLEKTELVEVYCFEQTEASTLSANDDYAWHLKECDVCIFLIDNADGVSDGVAKEFEIVQRYKKKALYYFCDETEKKETFIEKIVKDSDIAKSRTVNKFEDLSKHGVQGLLEDIISLYRGYCKGWLEINGSQNINNSSENFLNEEILKDPQFPKSILKDLDNCRRFVLGIVGFSSGESKDNKISNIDEWGLQFLEVLFENKTIKNFNSSLFLEEIKEQQNDDYHRVVCIRWNAIQKYFIGDVVACINEMEEALQLAKDTNQPSWLVQDILIDIRNQSINLDTINNCFTESKAQKELNESNEAVYYPLLDRFYQSLQEKYIKGLFKEATKNPDSVTIGVNYDEYGDLFASSLIVSMYNGSLTHILLIYDRLFDFLFYLNYVEDTWPFKRELLKFAIFLNDKNKVQGILRSFPEILSNIDADDALIIMKFCDNNPIEYQKFKSQMLAFGSVGYYLSDDEYGKYEALILNKIENWINDDKKIIDIGNQIFDCLYKIHCRINQNKLAYICVLFIKNHLRYWYRDLFMFIARAIDLNGMSKECRNKFIIQVINVLDDEEDKKSIEHEDKTFLIVLRNQDLLHTQILDEKIKEIFPNFYNGSYKLETTKNPQRDFPVFIKHYIGNINERNNSQGGNKGYPLYAINNINTIRAILLDENFHCPAEQMDSVISAIADTLLNSRWSICSKLDAISLLNCIILNYDKDYERNKNVFNTIIKKSDEIVNIENMLFDANIDKLSINIGLCLLQIAMGDDAYEKMLEGIAHIYDDVATIRRVTTLIVDYLEVNDSVIFPENINALILQNTLKWLNFKDDNIRYNSTRILLYLLRNFQNSRIVCQKILELIDSNSSVIKELILRQINSAPNIDEVTIEYVISRCLKDTNYVVRKCAKMLKNNR